MEPLIFCTDTQANILGIFALDVAPRLLFYSYVPIIFIAILIGTFVLFKNKFSLLSKLLFSITLFFSLFIINEIVLWTAIPAGVIHFSWSLSMLLRLLIIVSTLYFMYVFAKQKDMPFLLKLVMLLISFPILIFLPTNLNVSGVDIDWCEGINGPLWYYLYALEAIIVALFIGLGIVQLIEYLRKKTLKALQRLYLLFGTAFFLIIFFFSEFFGELMGIYEINLVGPIGMVGFLVVLSYLIVKFKIFNLNVIGAQALVIILCFLVGSLIFVAQSATTKTIAGITLLSAVVLGYILVRSVKQTHKQKEEIEKLAGKLQKANEQLKVLDKMKSEFVSIASHQLRSPLTSIRGYSSMLLEGSFGPLPAKAKDAIQRIDDSSRFMASSVEDYLNVSRIQAGNMKYEYSDFNLKDLAERVADDTRQIAIKKGILVLFKSDMTKKGIVHADIGKTKQVIDNLINNAMKYTPKGSITIFVHDDPKKKKIYVDVSDTGIGMSPRTIDNIFGKFERADNANNVNVTGTGLGLYIARKMAREMGGEITASSEGEGKGSIFTIELPLMM